MSTENPSLPAVAAQTLWLGTYEGIRNARKNKIAVTEVNFQAALKAQRQLTADLAVAAAVALGEVHAQSRLSVPAEVDAPKPYDLQQRAAKASKAFSKLVYWYGKFTVGGLEKFYQLHLGAVSDPSPEDAYNPNQDEESDDGESDEDDDQESDEE